MHGVPGRYREDKKSYVDSVAADHLNVSLRTAIAPAGRVAYRFDALLVALTESGEIRYSTPSSPRGLEHRREDILVVPRGVPIYTDYLNPTSAAPLVCITLEIDEDIIAAVLAAKPVVWPDAENYTELYALDDIDAFMRTDAAAAMKRIDHLLRTGHAIAGRDALVDTISRELLLYVMQSHARTAVLARAPRASRLGALAHYIDANLAAALDTAALAHRAHMSRSAFHAHFVATFGQTPAAFVRQRRLERARQLLVHAPEASLATIAAECGFGNASHFVQVFRRAAGTAPAAYRRATRR